MLGVILIIKYRVSRSVGRLSLAWAFLRFLLIYCAFDFHRKASCGGDGNRTRGNLLIRRWPVNLPPPQPARRWADVISFLMTKYCFEQGLRNYFVVFVRFGITSRIVVSGCFSFTHSRTNLPVFADRNLTWFSDIAVSLVLQNVSANDTRCDISPPAPACYEHGSTTSCNMQVEQTNL